VFILFYLTFMISGIKINMPIIKNIDNRILFCLITMILCFIITDITLIPDYLKLPDKKKDMTWFSGKYTFNHGKEFNNPKRYWEYNPFNGFISPVENMITILCMFFGLLRLVDLMKLFYIKNKKSFL
jgi:hypothetical protein